MNDSQSLTYFFDTNQTYCHCLFNKKLLQKSLTLSLTFASYIYCCAIEKVFMDLCIIPVSMVIFR